MAEELEYLSLEGLKLYDAQVKEYILSKIKAESTNIQNTINASLETIRTDFHEYWKTAYPVGSIYITVNENSPALLFGGTWTRIKDKFLLASGDIYETGETGGEATHQLTIEELPSHNHDLLTYRQYNTGSSTDGVKIGRTQSNADGGNRNISTENAGGGQAHNNMPPYIAVKIWRRVE